MLQPELKRYTEANRAAWNEVMPKHQLAAKEKWDTLFSQPSYVSLADHEVKLLLQIGLKGKNVAHLCCNNGVELMSLKNLGADTCVGFDISDEAIKEASERATLCGIDCQFVRSDIYEIDAVYSNRFDIVYISAGCLGWMPDLRFLFEKAAALLTKDGVIFIHEIHPFSEMLPFDNSKTSDTLRIIEPYFKEEPYIEKGGLDYVGNSEYDAATTQYWFIHTISNILMGMINNRIRVEHFSEYEIDISAGHHQIETMKAGIPLSFILIGKRIN